MPYLRFFVFLSILVVVSCGGGGGSGGGVSDGTGEPVIGFPTDYRASQATLNRENALDFVFAHQQFVDLIEGFKSDFLGFFSPNLGNPDSILADEVECPDNKYNIKETERSLQLSFFGCQYKSYTINGEIKYSNTGYTEDGSFAATLIFSDFSLKSSSRDIVYNGKLLSAFLNHEFTTTQDSVLEFTDNSTGKSFAWTDLLFNRLEFQATIHAKEYGFVNVYLDRSDESLRFEGAQSSALLAKINYDNTGVTRELVSYALTFSADGAQSSEELDRPVPVNALQELQQLPSSAPSAVIGSDASTYRLAGAAFSGAGSIDSNYDFFSYYWEVVDGPAGCDAEVNDPSHELVTITFGCQGRYTVRLTVEDWSGASSQSVDIDVLPLAAEISTPQNVAVGASQSLDVLLQVANLEQDGPFTYSLIGAPNGLSIDASGRITGTPQAFLDEGRTVFTVVARVENGLTADHSFSFQYENEKQDKPFVTGTAFCRRDAPEHWGDVNGNGRLNLVCVNDESYRVLEIVDGLVTSLYSSAMSLSPTTKIMGVEQQDLNGDGKEEILVGYDDKIMVVSGEDYTLIADIPVPWYNDDPEPGSYGARVSYEILSRPEGGPQIVVSAPQLNDGTPTIYLMNLDGTYVTFGRRIAGDVFIADIDGDSAVEVWESLYGSTFFHDLGHSPVEIPNTTDFLADMDGDGLPELIELGGGNFYPGGYDPYTISFYDVRNGEKKYSQSFGVDDDYSRLAIQVLNVDADEAMELVLRDEVNQIVYVLKWTGSELSRVGKYPEPEGATYLAYFAALGNEVVADYGDPQSSFTFSVDGGFQVLDVAAPRYITSSGVSNVFLRSGGELALYANEQQLKAARLLLSDSGQTIEYQPFDTLRFFKDSVLELNDGASLLVDTIFGDDGNDGYALIDGATQALLGQTTFEKDGTERQLYRGDIDGDGRQDVIAAANSRGALQWFSVEEDREYWRDASDDYTDGPFPVLVEDLDGNGYDDIIAMREVFTAARESYVAVSVFEYNGSAIVLKAELRLEGGYKMGLQDVDNDGHRELIIAQRLSLGCLDGAGKSAISVYKSDLAPHSAVTVADCIESIATFPAGVTKRNILAGVIRSQSVVSSRALQFSKLIEFSTETPQRLWESNTFLGRLFDNSFSVFDESSSDVKGVLRSTAGLYILK